MTAFRASPNAPEQNVTPRAAAVRPRSDLVALLFLVMVWAIIVVAINPAGEFALNDDWVYALAVRSILDTGRFALPSPAAANVIAQAYWGALFCLPFGFSFTALRISTLVFGGIGVLALYLLLREFGAHRRIALLGALTMAVNPLYLGMAASFMTDVPFTSLVTVSLWLYVRGARREDAVSLGGAFVLAFAAIFVRQFALVLPLAFGVAHIARKGTGRRALAIAVLPFVLGIALQLAYAHWLIATGRTPVIPAPLSNLLPRMPLRFVLRAGNAALKILPYLGLCVAPFLAYLVLARRWWAQADGWRPSSSWRLVALLSVGLMAALVASRKIVPAFDNILTSTGLGPLTLRDTYLLQSNQLRISAMTTELWLVATALGACAAVLVGLALVPMLASLARNLRCREWRRAAWPQLLMFTVVGSYTGGLLLFANSEALFDRYLLPLIPPLMALLLMQTGDAWPVRERFWRVLPCCLLLVLYAAFSMSVTHDYLAWNRARSRATEFLMQAGVTPHQIDGGYEFNGWYLYRPDYKEEPGKSYWWVDDDEYVISSGPLSGYDVTERFRFNRWLGLTQSSVVILHRVAASPSRPPVGTGSGS